VYSYLKVPLQPEGPEGTVVASVVHVGGASGPGRAVKPPLPLLPLAVAAVLLSLSACKHPPRVSLDSPLASAEQVSQLTPDEAAAQVPVHLRGTITFAEGGLSLLFVQDATGAVRVKGAPLAGMDLAGGRSVELTGVTASGGSDPVVTSRRIVMGDRLDGRIECRSQLGVGTTFSFTLPKIR
jgi:hypothetical protein